MSHHLEEPESGKVLIVDDNEANRSLARHALEHERYTVCAASSGEQGLEVFDREESIGCILMDVRLPGLDGFATCEKLRQHRRGADVPVIFLTGLRDVDTFDRALRAGGDDFLTKPVRPTELVVRVRTALKLRSVRHELSDHLELLKRQRDDLMRLQLQKERLMAFVVHDLKNPVNSLDLHAQLLLRDRGLSADARESATQIRTDARLLNRMILNLLDLSKADEGKLAAHASSISVPDLVREVFADLEANARRREVALRSSLDVETMRADGDLLRRALTNLVENGVRHSMQGSAVQVSVYRKGAAVEIRVTDAGPGVRSEHKERIFDAYSRGDGDANPQSRGLGLTFCRTVAEAHQGRIWVEDATPGSVFCLSLPQ